MRLHAGIFYQRGIVTDHHSGGRSCANYFMPYLTFGLIPRMSGPGCQEGAAVMGGEFLIQAIGPGVVPVGILDQCAGLIRYD